MTDDTEIEFPEVGNPFHLDTADTPRRRYSIYSQITGSYGFMFLCPVSVSFQNLN
jgi:hypothetical protein